MKGLIIVCSLLVLLGVLNSCSLDNSNNRIFFEGRTDVLEVDKRLGGDTYIYPLNADGKINENEYIKVDPTDVIDFVWTSKDDSCLALFVLKSEVSKTENQLNTNYYHVYDYSNSQDFHLKYFNEDENDTNKIILKESYKRQMIHLENY